MLRPYILAHPGNGEGELLRYVSLRIPQLVARFLPYSVLLATILTLATFNQNSEVTAMKAAGLSAHQILAPLILAALLVSGFSFAFNERIVTRATATLSVWEANDYGPLPRDASSRANIYLNDGNVSTSADKRAAYYFPMGIYADADFADLYIQGLETSQIAFPIVLDGAGGDYAGGHGDVHIRGLVLDQIIGDGVTIRNANPFPVRYEIDFPKDGNRLFSGISGRVVEKPGKRVWTATIPANSSLQLSYRASDRE